MITDIQDKINLLSSPQAWERQVTAIELGDLGDLRAVIPLRNTLKKERVEEVIIAIEKALKRIAEKNGFESIEAMILEWERKERELEERISRGTPETLTTTDIIQFFNLKITKTKSGCIETACPFYIPNAQSMPTLIDQLPQINKDHNCLIYHAFNDPTEQYAILALIALLALEWSSQNFLKIQTCQNGYVFLRNYYSLLGSSEQTSEQETLTLIQNLVVQALAKSLDDYHDFQELFSTFSTEQLLLLKKALENTPSKTRLQELILEHLNAYIAKIKEKYPSLTSIIKRKKEERKLIKGELAKTKKKLSVKLGLKKKAISKQEQELKQLEQELKQLLLQRKHEEEKIKSHLDRIAYVNMLTQHLRSMK